MRTRVTGLLAVLALTSPASAQDVQCTIKLEACAGLEQNLSPLLKVKEGGGVKMDLLEVGKKPKSPYHSALVWLGGSVSGDTLVFGKGEVKVGIALECTWNLGQPKPQQQIDSLKASLPRILENKEFQKQFPAIKRIDVSGLKTIEDADGKCAEALAAFAKAKK